MWLFFGCRRRDLDFLYRRELEAAAAKGNVCRGGWVWVWVGVRERARAFVRPRVCVRARALARAHRGEIRDGRMD